MNDCFGRISLHVGAFWGLQNVLSHESSLEVTTIYLLVGCDEDSIPSDGTSFFPSHGTLLFSAVPPS